MPKAQGKSLLTYFFIMGKFPGNSFLKIISGIKFATSTSKNQKSLI